MTDPAHRRSSADDPQRVWSLGDYDAIAAHLQPIADETVAAAGVGAGMSVLDVGVGSGNAAVAGRRRHGCWESAPPLDARRLHTSSTFVECDVHGWTAQ